MIGSYDKYKTVDDIWIDAIPEHWDFSSLKYFVEIINGYAFKSIDYSDDEGIPIIRIGDISYPVDVPNAKKATPKNLDELDRFIIKKGDLLLAMTGATIGKSCLYDSDEIAYVNQRVGLLRSKNMLTQNFLKYYIDTPLFREFITLSCSGSAQENISATQISGIKFPLPSINEQSQIVKFLNHQTSLVDEIISRKEKQIVLLKEKYQATINEIVTNGFSQNSKKKDSGIEWLGKIPEEWRIIPLKHIAILKGRLGWKGLKADEYVDEGYGFLSTPDIKDEVIDFSSINHITEERYLESPEIMLEVGDVLLVKDGSTLGITNIIKELPIPSTVNSSIGVIRVIDTNQILPEYLYIQLGSNYIQSVIGKLKAGQGVPHLFQKDIKNFNIILPSINEQLEIVRNVEFSKQTTSSLIQQLNNQIEKLKEYRQSIITDAVTGKVDVRDWQPNNA